MTIAHALGLRVDVLVEMARKPPKREDRLAETLSRLGMDQAMTQLIEWRLPTPARLALLGVIERTGDE